MKVARLSELPEEGAVRVQVGSTPVCLARSGGELFAVNDVCSHADVSLSEGDVEDGTVECWLHGSRFDLRTECQRWHYGLLFARLRFFELRARLYMCFFFGSQSNLGGILDPCSRPGRYKCVDPLRVWHV